MEQDSEIRFVNYLSHFLVSLGCISISSRLITPAREQKFFTSAFVMELEGVWYLVTAGHVLNRIKAYVEGWRDLLHEFVIFPSFGTFTIPAGLQRFAYRDPVFCEVRDSGLDFGAIRLTPTEQGWLQQIGVLPVEERFWNQTLPDEFDDYALLGLPTQDMELDRQGEASIQPVYIRVEPTDDLPEDYAGYTDPMHFYRIMEPTRPDLDIEGMSGCPVFAFHKPAHSDDVKTIIFAMQSSWFRSRKVIATSSLRFAGNLLRDRERGGKG